MSDKEPTRSELNNAEYIAMLWLIERRINDSSLTITGRRPYCRR